MLQPSHKPLPEVESRRCRAVGTVYADTIPIFIHQKVMDEIIDYSESDSQREIGGFLIGGIHEDRRVYCEIRRFLPAVETESGVASLVFTHESWAAVHRKIEEEYPDDRIVGWHHTHPGLGIFLSGYDLFIHKHYFSQPWEVALVVDPQRNEFGFFQWRGDEVVTCGFVCVLEET